MFVWPTLSLQNENVSSILFSFAPKYGSKLSFHLPFFFLLGRKNTSHHFTIVLLCFNHTIGTTESPFWFFYFISLASWNLLIPKSLPLSPEFPFYLDEVNPQVIFFFLEVYVGHDFLSIWTMEWHYCIVS